MEIRGTVKAEGGEEVQIRVVDGNCGEEILKRIITGKTPKLVGKWCTCKPVDEGEIVYPQYGECYCGVQKEHVHRVACGHITQVG